MGFDRTGSAPFQFNANRLGTIKPYLAEPEGIDLSTDELKLVFGIQEQYFAKLPKRIVIPVLEGRWYTEHWYSTTGYLYVVEPEAWVPQVSHGDTMPASAFKTTYVREEETITETKFNAGTSAEVSIEAGGTFYGVTANVKSTSDISFRYSSSTTTKESLETTGTSGNAPIHQLFVYPKLRCKVIRKQRIDYTINDSSEELKWTGDSYRNGYWGERWVSDKRLGRVRNLGLHPVPMDGNGLGHKAYVLPIPELTDGGDDIDVTTIMSRQGWVDWYVYDIDWEEVEDDETIDLAAPRNGVAFRPMTTWTTLPPINPDDE
ncbi:hypothetical protein UCRNP2_512 [Neofusicoccum parvum UCRNP2]|uniref:Uncharacterized protein n=1 Tax=Botryosphaeria parva (strain UCR-NP2) TaxID=1287680 RepID=R1EY29_BOTPV|nr:hypothetical protein UCRNP2_512 [Neofusicoccum parvum UCRNP2]